MIKCSIFTIYSSKTFYKPISFKLGGLNFKLEAKKVKLEGENIKRGVKKFKLAGIILKQKAKRAILAS